jgi:hypothetical protein
MLEAVGCSALILIEAPPQQTTVVCWGGAKPVHQEGGDLRRLYTTQHPLYCGIDLHARTMDVCILDQHSAVLGHRHMQTSPAAFLHVIAPHRQGLIVAVGSG